MEARFIDPKIEAEMKTIIKKQTILNKRDFLNQFFGQYLKERQGYIETREFIEGRNGPIRRFHRTIEEIVKHIPRGNFYFGVCPRENTNSGRKENICYTTVLWTDLDYGQDGHKKKSKFATQEEALTEVRKFEFKPSIVVNSGGGLYIYWVLKELEEIKDVSYIEGIIKGVTQYLGGDIGTQDITRILRVPDTFNLKLPDKPRRCEVIEFNQGKRYNLSDFEHYRVSLSSNQALSNVSFPENLPKIDLRTLKVDTHIKKLIKEGDTESIYASRSECDLAVINALILAGYDDAIVKAIFSDPRRKISEKYLERASKNQSADSYLGHSIGKARVLKENIDSVSLLLKERKFEEAESEIEKLPEQYKETYKKRLLHTSAWLPKSGDDSNIFSVLIRDHGQPYYFNKSGNVCAVNESFLAELYFEEHILLYDPIERVFYRYEDKTGLYTEITEHIIKKEIAGRILQISRERNIPSLERLKKNSVLTNIIANLKGIAERRNTFVKQFHFVHLGNGILYFNNSGTVDFVKFSPTFFSRNQSPICYNPNAKCERFKNELLYPAVKMEDAILIQKYAGLCILGNNLSQRLLILDGDSERGKSTLALIIQKLVGLNNVTELRTRHLAERFELFRYLKRTLLVGVDVPGNFLSQKGSYVIKGLLGGDYFDAEQKCGTGSF